MHETARDIREHLETAVVAIATNGSLIPDGRAIFGRGVAGRAALRYPGLVEKLGRLLAEGGNHVFDPGDGIVTFPFQCGPAVPGPHDRRTALQCSLKLLIYARIRSLPMINCLPVVI